MEITPLEVRVSNLETRMAVAERDIQTINQKLDKIDANVTKLIWIVMASVIGTVLKLAIG